ncbi:MAG: dihydrolipoyl dehydrogenase [marine bacterium B5-7]|nr:MAG: dihydrolipoyl dehydrogenase [marine bacterium B5-7]
MSDQYDIVIIGGGPGGYVAAIRAAQLGLKTACIDSTRNAEGKGSPGGTCLNVGCIPSKALLDSSERYESTRIGLSAHGIEVSEVTLRIDEMLARKDRIVNELTSGIGMLFKANGIDYINGHGTLHADHSISIAFEGDDKSKTIKAKHIILASGSEPTPLPPVPFDNEVVVDSTGALAFSEVPTRLGVIGAGVIGLELGSVWRRLGSEVTVLEALKDFLPAADKNVSRDALRQFKKQGLDIKLGAKVTSAEVKKGKCFVEYESGDEKQSVEFDRLIVAIGRRPFTDQLFDDDTGIKKDKRGFIQIDENNLTAMKNVYAVGDVVTGPMLAHKASEEGVAVAERIAGHKAHVDFNTVPWVIYTHPEIAWVGQTEQQLKESSTPIKTGMFSFAATGRAKAMNETGGFVKIIAHETTDQILGVHIVGPHASELIAEAVLAMEYRASSEDLARTIHAHPTLSEAVHEAALAVTKRAIHKAN